MNLVPEVDIAGTRQTGVGECAIVLAAQVMDFANVGAVNFAPDAKNCASECRIYALENGNSAPQSLSLATNFADELSLGNEHFFVVVDLTDKIAVEEIVAVEEIAAVDPNVENS